MDFSGWDLPSAQIVLYVVPCTVVLASCVIAAVQSQGAHMYTRLQLVTTWHGCRAAMLCA